jgi:glycosyltransferase involved in cell wall biosynthesis
MAEQDMRSPKLLMVGPMPTVGNYNGGISTIMSMMLERWGLPYEIITYNTNTDPRGYGSVNRLNAANVRRFFRNAIDLVKLVRQERPDIVHFHTSRHLALLKDLGLVGLIRLFGGCKVVGHVHWASYPTLLVGRSRLGRALQLKLLMAFYDRVVLMSESIKRELSCRLSSAGSERFNAKAKVVYNFTKVPKLTARHPRSTDPVRFFFIGNLGPEKGVFDLLQAAAVLRQKGLKGFEIVLAGPFDSPAEGHRIKSLIASLGLTDTVRITGPVSGALKESLFEAANIFVLPSYGEGLPLSMLEAMAYSLPVIATSVGGIPEVLQHGEMGILVKPGDLEELASAMRRLIVSPELRVEMGSCGRTRVEKFHSPEQFFHELRCLYRELIEPPFVKRPAEANSPA